MTMPEINSPEDEYYKLLKKTEVPLEHAQSIWDGLVDGESGFPIDRKAEKYLDKLIHPEPKDPKFKEKVFRADFTRNIITATEEEVLRAVETLNFLYVRAPGMRPRNGDIVDHAIQRIADSRLDHRTVLQWYYDRQWHVLGLNLNRAIDNGNGAGAADFFTFLHKLAERRGVVVQSFTSCVRESSIHSPYGDYLTPSNRPIVDRFDRIRMVMNAYHVEGHLTIERAREFIESARQVVLDVGRS